MNLKKLVAISDLFPNFASPRKKVVSGFGLGVASFFIVLCVVSFKNPNVFRGFNVNNDGSSMISWSFSFSTTPTSVKNATDSERSPGEFVELGDAHFGNFTNDVKNGSFEGVLDLKGTHLGNFTNDVKNGSFEGVLELKGTQFGDITNDVKNGSFDSNSDQIVDLEGTHFGNFTNDVKNGSFERVVDLKGTQFGDVTNDVKNGSFDGISDKVLDLEGTHFGNFTNDVKNGTSKEILDLEGTHLNNFTNDVKNGSFDAIFNKVLDLDGTHFGNFTNDAKNGSFDSISDRIKGTHFGNFTDDVKNGNGSVRLDSMNSNFILKNNLRNFSGSYEECDIFDGRWVRDDTKPYYPAGSCPYVDRDFDCHLNKRPDDEYVKWKWQPFGCEIASLNPTDFLERLRGKKFVFVGDSLNRNMWESLVCILREALTDKNKVYEISGRTEFKKKGFYAFRFEDYNCTIDFVSSPFLVRESSFKGKNGSIETLRLDLMDQTTSMYHDADVLVFNTGHWWTHEKTSRGEDYYQEGDHVYPRLKVLDAYNRALSTWARWVDTNIDTNKTQVIFRGYSVTHFRGGQWNSGGKCHKETEPIFNTTHLTKYPSKMRAFDHILRDMKAHIIYLNISRLTDYRKDGHPSIYRMAYKTLEDQIAAERSQDCSHWCLPGVPDTWNELLYASLLKIGKGSWRI